MKLLVLLLLVPAAGGELPAGPAPGLGEDEIVRLIAEARRWVRELRSRHRPGARPLTAAERNAYAGYLPAEVLADARVRLLPGLENPPFYDRIFPGQPPPIDFRRMAGMSLRDTVVAVETRVDPSAPEWRDLLFHELVHNTQHHLLGDARYFEEYVRGWVASGSYGGIPIERQAYELTARFAAGERFSVVQAIRARFLR